MNKIEELKEKVENGEFDDNELIDLVIYYQNENKLLSEENLRLINEKRGK